VDRSPVLAEADDHREEVRLADVAAEILVAEGCEFQDIIRRATSAR
jgi:hypothetical protein